MNLISQIITDALSNFSSNKSFAEKREMVEARQTKQEKMRQAYENNYREMEMGAIRARAIQVRRVLKF